MSKQDSVLIMTKLEMTPREVDEAAQLIAQRVLDEELGVLETAEYAKAFSLLKQQPFHFRLNLVEKTCRGNISYVHRALGGICSPTDAAKQLLNTLWADIIAELKQKAARQKSAELRQREKAREKEAIALLKSRGFRIERISKDQGEPTC